MTVRPTVFAPARVRCVQRAVVAAALVLLAVASGCEDPAVADDKDTLLTQDAQTDAAGTDTAETDVWTPDFYYPDEEQGSDGQADGTDDTGLDTDVGIDPSGCNFSDPQTGACGWPCTNGIQDCTSGWCAETPDGGRCTKPCGEGGCPTNWDCINVALFPDPQYACAPRSPKLGKPCKSDPDCFSALGTGVTGLKDACVPNGTDGAYCGADCSTPSATCPTGFACKNVQSISGKSVKQCVPTTPDAVCTGFYSTLGTETSCSSGNNNGTCFGTRRCEDGKLTACSAKTPTPEKCNTVDDDCDGITDEPIPNAKCDVVSGIYKCPGVPFCQNGVEQCLGQKPSAEGCDGLDNDCNGQTDEGCDDDKDGYCDGSMAFVPTAGLCPKGGNDCNDLDAGKFPTAKELCNGEDDNCNQLVDGDDPLLLLNDPKKCENQKGVCSGASKGADLCSGGKWQPCDDNTYQKWNASYSPGDVCDDKDNDCSGKADDGCDDDKDGYCDSSIATVGFPLTCPKGGGDCVDNNNKVFPGAIEQCDDIDQNCNQFNDEGCDDDSDGQCDANYITVGTPKICTKGGGDCADLEPNRFLGNTELCNGKDDNCVLGADETFQDVGQVCGDGKGVCKVTGITVCAPDGKSAVCSQLAGSPQVEICDGLDNDCNAQTDEGCDDDDDNFCDANMATVGKPTVCPNGGNDCADNDDQTYPGALEVCDNADNDCDSKVDGADGDLLIDDPQLCNKQLGACKGSRKPVSLCVNGKWSLCAEAQYVSWNSGYKTTEQCDNVDNDCTGITDEGCDDDNDGFCNKNALVVGFVPTCELGLGDCNDEDFALNPGAIELCDNKDNDCDGDFDEGCDDDADDYCDASRVIPPGITPNTCIYGGNDCDDNNKLKNPGAAEVCGDFVDDNCSGTTDEAPCNSYISGVLSVGPDYRPDGFVQCAGFFDQPAGDDVPANFGANCANPIYGKIRVACANAALTQIRYIDIAKNVFFQGLSSSSEAGLIINANFDLAGNNAISYNTQNFQWRFVQTTVGCDETLPSLLINNNSCGSEAANCFGLNLGGASRQLLIYAGK
jgi:hypothetical protein